MSSENQCTGCGATVTPTKVFGLLHDADGMMHCQSGPNKGDTHSIELPPVSIKPEAAPLPLKWDRQISVIWQDQGTFAGSHRGFKEIACDVEPEFGPLFAAAPELLAALRAIIEAQRRTPFGYITPEMIRNANTAIVEAEAVQV